MLDAIERSLTETRLRREKEALTERVIQANRDLQRRIQELNVLYSVGKSVTALSNMDQLLPHIVDAAAQLTQAEESNLYLIAEGNRLLCCAQKRAKAGRAQIVSFEANDPIAGHVLKAGVPIVLTPEQLAGDSGGPLSASYAPLTVGNQIIGVLGVANISPYTATFTKHDSASERAVRYAAIAIENSRATTSPQPAESQRKTEQIAAV
jgi:transcriptional regulator with GAF, ATPase, and Fis domain